LNKLKNIKKELVFFGLFDKAQEIHDELGSESAISYIRSSYRLLSKVYHPDLNPKNREKAKQQQQRLNDLGQRIKAVSDNKIISLLRKDIKEKKVPIQGKIRVLVVEDEFGLQEILRDIFVMEGYNVRIATDGEEGYKAYLKFKPDLIVTDIVMPKMTGLELIQKIRLVNPEIKVIYVSGFFGVRGIKGDIKEEIQRYDYPYLAKPFRISQMLRLVDEYLNKEEFSFKQTQSQWTKSQ